jgi:hypothetical protein
MDVDDALAIVDNPESCVDELHRTLAAAVRKLREAAPYIPCECGRKIYIPAAELRELGEKNRQWTDPPWMDHRLERDGVIPPPGTVES